ncbi:MAG: hypothetical protein H6754_08970 [Candidatus Omnitrophica bacterium]|nr:hypothetical protein [Candidatus Omnitrophota bacterium]
MTVKTEFVIGVFEWAGTAATKRRTVFLQFALADKAKPMRFLERIEVFLAENTTGGVDNANKAGQ